jgi:hypothetical protein
MMLGRFFFMHEFKNKFGAIKAVVPSPTDLRNSLRVVFMDTPFTILPELAVIPILGFFLDFDPA